MNRRYFDRVSGPTQLTLAGAERDRQLLSVVVPCANEQEVIRETNARLVGVLERLPMPFEIIYVDDGSSDSTPEILRELQLYDSRLRIVRFSRNFGHQIAITAGVEHAAGDAVVVIDGDLQDPPEVILEFVDKWQEGYDVVYGVRTEREGESAFKLWTAKYFYRFISKLSDTEIPLDTGDFRLMDRRVVDALLEMPERDRFVRGMVSWIGYSQSAVPYRRAARAAGSTKFSLFKMMRFATDGIVSFSIVPLRLATWVGFIASGIAILGIVVAVLERLFGAVGLVKGWASLVIAVLFLGGVQLICMGIIGEYVGRIYGESKRRPLYVIRDRMGFGEAVRTGAETQVPRNISASK
ncbi:MAG: glycosyltransferase family 2 protein [Candidatus Acidiferrales bacterium]